MCKSRKINYAYFCSQSHNSCVFYDSTRKINCEEMFSFRTNRKTEKKKERKIYKNKAGERKKTALGR